MLDNNDGITIIDVTDPESSAYCFASIRGLECQDRSNIPVMTPLSATQYLRGYYPKVEMDDSDSDSESETRQADDKKIKLEQSVLNTLLPFESVRMITFDMLAETWPGDYKSDEPNPVGLSNDPKESSATSIHIPPSLVDITFIPALNYALQTGETDRLDPLMWLPENLAKIKETLRARNPLSENDLALLSKVIAIEVKQNKSIDLSHFSPTGENLIELLSAHEGVEVLNISHMQQITTDNLRQLIPLLPNLRRLVLLHTIPDADILSLLSESPELFYRIDSIIHFAFLRHLGQAVYPATFSHIITRVSGEVVVASIPYFTPDQLVQGLTDYLSLLKSEDAYNVLTCMRHELPLLATYASAVREPGRSWSERIVPFIPRKASEKLDERDGWFFTWSVSYSHSLSYRYAFAKINKEVMEECQRKIDELRESLKLPPSHLDSDTPQSFERQGAEEPEAENNLDDNSKAKTSLLSYELRVKEDAIKSEYADRKFHIFDVKSFFEELVKEGRPAPSPEALTKLLELFAFLEKTPSRDDASASSRISLMTLADLKSFFEMTHEAQNYLRYMEQMNF